MKKGTEIKKLRGRVVQVTYKHVAGPTTALITQRIEVEVSEQDGHGPQNLTLSTACTRGDESPLGNVRPLQPITITVATS